MTWTHDDVTTILTTMREDICMRTGVFVSMPYLEFDEHLRKICRERGLDEMSTRRDLFAERTRLILPEPQDKSARLERFRLWSELTFRSGFRGDIRAERMPLGIQEEISHCFEKIFLPLWSDSSLQFERHGRRRFVIQVINVVNGYKLDHQIHGPLGVDDNLLHFESSIFGDELVLLQRLNTAVFFGDHVSRVSSLTDVEKFLSKFAMMIDYMEQHFRAATSLTCSPVWPSP